MNLEKVFLEFWLVGKLLTFTKGYVSNIIFTFLLFFQSEPKRSKTK